MVAPPDFSSTYSQLQSESSSRPAVPSSTPFAAVWRVKLPRRRRPRKAGTGYEVHQLELPFENDDGEQDLSPESQRLRLGRLNKNPA